MDEKLLGDYLDQADMMLGDATTIAEKTSIMQVKIQARQARQFTRIADKLDERWDFNKEADDLADEVNAQLASPADDALVEENRALRQIMLAVKVLECNHEARLASSILIGNPLIVKADLNDLVRTMSRESPHHNDFSLIWECLDKSLKDAHEKAGDSNAT